MGDGACLVSQELSQNCILSYESHYERLYQVLLRFEGQITVQVFTAGVRQQAEESAHGVDLYDRSGGVGGRRRLSFGRHSGQGAHRGDPSRRQLVSAFPHLLFIILASHFCNAPHVATSHVFSILLIFRGFSTMRMKMETLFY